MISAGVDVGAQNTKVAILSDGAILSCSIVVSGMDAQRALSRAFTEALGRAGIQKQAIDVVGVTGMGKEIVPSANSVTSSSTAGARGAQFFLPSARTVIDIGAEQSQVLALDELSHVLEAVRNEKCAAGAGAFLEEMASIVQVPVEEFGALSLRSGNQIYMNSHCVVFAESEVVSLLRNGAAIEDVAYAVNDAIAARTFSMISGIPVKRDILFIGGVARNKGIVRSLSRRLEKPIIVPPEPGIVSAVGAAVIAGERLLRCND
jgi:predicted CoA-substrate-specific enzyme activase